MTLAEIAEASGLPARTVRFYIARGLLNGPVKGGRVAAYTADHVERLERIKHLQATGHTLLEIGRILGGPSAEEPEAVPATAWWQHAIADDVIVWVRADAGPWRTKQLRAALEEFARRVRPEKKTKGKESEIT
jgi:DNA-binding transcriptional MerR regulator